MKNKLFVFDTNTLVSATLLKASTSRRCLNAALSSGTLVFSHETFNELRTVLIRSKFDKYVSLPLRLDFLEILEAKAEIKVVVSDFMVCRNPKDNIFLNLAFDSSAHCIVSGDADLLVLNPFKEIPVITPAEFLNLQS